MVEIKDFSLAEEKVSDFFRNSGLDRKVTITPANDENNLWANYKVKVGTKTFKASIPNLQNFGFFEIILLKSKIGHSFYEEKVTFFTSNFMPHQFIIFDDMTDQIIQIDKSVKRDNRIQIYHHCHKFSGSLRSYVKEPLYYSKVLDLNALIKNYGLQDEDNEKVSYFKDYLNN